MKTNNWIILPFMAVCAFAFTGCEAIGSIFKAGVWSGVLLVVGLIALIIFIISKMGGKK